MNLQLLSDVEVLCKIEPQPPKGIKYMLGNESWLPAEDRSKLMLSCEEWGNLGPMELNPEIKENDAGLRVKHSEFYAPEGADCYKEYDGIYYWARFPVIH